MHFHYQNHSNIFCNREENVTCFSKTKYDIDQVVGTQWTWPLRPWVVGIKAWDRSAREVLGFWLRSFQLFHYLSWIMALSRWRGLHSSIKPWTMPCRATQDGWVIVKSSDKMRSTRGGNGKPLQCFCWENTMNGMKRQKDRTLEREPSGWKESSMLLGKSREHH